MRAPVSLLAVLLIFLAVGCRSRGPSPGHRDHPVVDSLQGGGATFVNPIMLRWAEVYKKAKGVQIHYQSLGSGKGIAGMIDRSFDFGCSDAPMKEADLKLAAGRGGEVAHIPLVLGAVVPTYNLPTVKQPLRFSGPVLAAIFLGKIKNWKEKPLQDLNKGIELPDLPIKVVHREDSSGTTFIWTDYLSKVSPEWKEKIKAGTKVAWPVGIGKKGNDGVAGLVSREVGAIGYNELTYAMANRLEFGSVRNREKEFVTANLQSVTAAAAAAMAHIPDDLRFTLTDAPGKDSYPISSASWALIYVHQPADKGQAVLDFLRWATHEGQKYTAELNLAPLPAELVSRIDQKLDGIQIDE